MIDLSAYASTLNGKGIAVYGLGKSGMATLAALRAGGVPVWAGDDDQARVAEAIDAGYPSFSAQDDTVLTQCAALVLAPGIPLTFPAPHRVVETARRCHVEIIGDIELLSRAQTGCRFVGITGTNGKSTTTALTAHVLNACGVPALAAGNIGVPVLSLDRVTPQSVIVIEMSSFQLDLCPTFRPDIAVHLNITPDHLDRHGDLSGYIAVKEHIFEGSGTGLCGVDDEYSHQMYDRAVARDERRMIPVSCINALNDGLSLSGAQIVDTAFEGGVEGSLSDLPTLRGRHNFQNALMAYGVARALGVSDTAAIFHAFETYPGLPHRQKLVREMNGVLYINDSKATNADATEKALLAYDRNYWIVGGKPKAGGLQGLEALTGRVRHAFLIGQASDDFAQWMGKNHVPYSQMGTLDRAVSAAHAMAQDDVHTGRPAGTVLLSPACASYDQFRSYEHRGDVFTELVQSLT